MCTGYCTVCTVQVLGIWQRHCDLNMPPKINKGRGGGGRSGSVASLSKTTVRVDCEEHDKEEEDDASSSGDESDDDTSVGVHVARGFSPCGKTKKQKFICSGGEKECGNRIKSGEDSVMCDGCKEWFHPKCQKLSTDSFKALSKHNGDFLWLCSNCKPYLMPVLEMRVAIQKQMEKSEKKILKTLQDTLTKEIWDKKLGSRIDNMETKLCSEMKEKQKQIEVSLKAQGEQTNDIKRLVENKQEKEVREKNIILHNISESGADDAEERVEHDKGMFTSVVSELLGNQGNVEVDKVIRLGKRADPASATQSKPRLMLVRVKDKDLVDALIKRRTQLRHKGFPNVYLTRDLTPDEREVQKKLRAELQDKGKETHMIFRGKVIQRQ